MSPGARRFATRSLSTFITPDPPLSTTQRGTAFEKRSLNILQDHMSMSLRRVGGKSDGGIDLLGWWWLPFTGSGSHHERRRFRVLAQCKAEKKKTSPKYVREMEGVMHRYMSLSVGALPPETTNPHMHTMFHQTQHPLVALLISESPFTKATVLRAQSSPVPLFLLHIPPIPDSGDIDLGQQESCIGTAVWNPALAGARGLLGGEMEIRWERSPIGGGRPSLWWRDAKLKSWTPDIEFSEISDHGLETQIRKGSL